MFIFPVHVCQVARAYFPVCWTGGLEITSTYKTNETYVVATSPEVNRLINSFLQYLCLLAPLTNNPYRDVPQVFFTTWVSKPWPSLNYTVRGHICELYIRMYCKNYTII